MLLFSLYNNSRTDCHDRGGDTHAGRRYVVSAASQPAFAPFRNRSFRIQWPADMATSWAFEMETLILGWYVLVETQSVTLLAFFASLQYTGTFVGPLLGVVG